MKKSETIWKAFCDELIVEPTEDMKEALATAIREIANQYQYYQCSNDSYVEDMVITARKMYELADELDSK